MTNTPQSPVAVPVGFPGCGRCAFVVNGPIILCTLCASRTLQPLAADRCPVCSQALDPLTRTCRNAICRDPGRRIVSIDAIAVFSGELRSTIIGYKYQGQKGWATIFGRLVLGHLQARWAPQALDVVIPNPTYSGPGGSDFPHTELVIERARREDVLSEYNLACEERPVLRKTGPTPRSAGANAVGRVQAAAALYSLLELPDPDAVRGRRVMIYDDVCTSGRQLATVARYLADEGGAAAVYGLVLARTAWA